MALIALRLIDRPISKPRTPDMSRIVNAFCVLLILCAIAFSQKLPTAQITTDPVMGVELSDARARIAVLEKSSQDFRDFVVEVRTYMSLLKVLFTAILFPLLVLIFQNNKIQKKLRDSENPRNSRTID